ncbi:hypothetical protein bcgnr5390_12300 [Bacillus luti]|nr:hypothetical protein BC2903_50980 [Bacillus cereus]
MTKMYESKIQNGEFNQNNGKIEKSKLIKKLRELTQANHIFADSIAINQSEIAVLMQTFGISWDELKQPSNTFSLYYKMVLTENDLRKQFDWHANTLKVAKEKGIKEERDMELMLTGFLNGVSFFNPELRNEFSLMADKFYN